MSIINNSQIVGSLGKDLVLNTLGKIYVRVGDRYYELDFLNKINTTDTSVGAITDTTESIESNVLVLNSISGIQYPGDNKLIVLTDGKFYVTKNGRYKNITPTTQSSATPQATITAITDAAVIGRLYSNNLILDFTSGDVTANTIKVKKIIADQISIKQNSENDNYFVSGSGKLYIGPEVPIINIDVQGEYVTFDIKAIPDVSLFPMNEIVTDEHESFLGQIVDVSTSTLKALILEGDPNDATKLILKGDFIQYDPRGKSLYNKTYNLRYADISKSGDYSDLEFATVASNVDVILKPGTFIKCLKDCTISVNKSFQYQLQSGALYLLMDSSLINLTRNLHYFNTLDEFYNYAMDSDDIAIIKETEQLYYKGILIGGKAQATLPDNFQIEDAQTGAVLSYDNGIGKPSMKYATYTYIDERFDYLLNNAPSALDTLGEIAEVLQKNINNVGDIIKAITAITNDVNNKVDQTEFYNTIQQINDQINSLDYSKTFKAIYDLLDKKADLELVNTLNTTIQSLKNVVDTKLDSTVFETEIEKLKKQLGATNLEDINKKLDSLTIQLQSKVDVKEFNDLSQKLSNLRQTISNISSTLETKVNTDIFNSEIARLDDHLKKINIDNIIAVLNDKATGASVKELESKFSDYASIAYVQGLFASINLDQYDKKLTELQSADEELLKLVNSNHAAIASQIEKINSNYQSTLDQIEQVNANYNILSNRVLTLESSINKIGGIDVKVNALQSGQILIYNQASNAGINGTLISTLGGLSNVADDADEINKTEEDTYLLVQTANTDEGIRQTKTDFFNGINVGGTGLSDEQLTGLNNALQFITFSTTNNTRKITLNDVGPFFLASGSYISGARGNEVGNFYSNISDIANKIDTENDPKAGENFVTAWYNVSTMFEFDDNGDIHIVGNKGFYTNSFITAGTPGSSDETVTGNATSLGGYPVNINNPQSNQSLVFDNNQWINKTISTSSTISSAGDGQFTNTTGTLLGTLTINNNEHTIYAPTSTSGGSSVQGTAGNYNANNGVLIGKLTIDGTSNNIYAPKPSSTTGGYTLPVATDTSLGGIMIGYPTNNNNYAVKISEDNQAFVTVPFIATEWYEGTMNTQKKYDLLGYNKGLSYSHSDYYIQNNILYVNKIQIGECQITWDEDATGLYFSKGIFSDSFITAGKIGNGESGDVVVGSTVTITNLLQVGTPIATITIDGTSHTLLAPTSGSSNSLTPATATDLGGIKIGFDESGKNYAVKLNTNGQAYVNVPWTDNNTTYSIATSSTLGLVKIGYTAKDKNYPVELDNGQMYVNVPWVDTNTDTKVTSVGNHYIPSGGSATTLTVSNSTLSFGGAVITGITQDAAGHITAVSTSKLPANPLDNLTELKIGDCTISGDESIGGLKFDKGIYSEQYITAGMPGGLSGAILTAWPEDSSSITDQQLVSAKLLYNDKQSYSQGGNAIGTLLNRVQGLEDRVKALENL